MRETTDAVVEEVRLIAENGTVLMQKDMAQCATATDNEFWTTSPIVIPDERFFIVS